MTITEAVKSDLDNHRKAQNRFEIKVLSTILGNLQGKAKLVEGEKVTSDADAIAYLKSHLKGLKEMATYSFTDDISSEISLVETYLPRQLNKMDLERILARAQVGTMKEYMAILKTDFEGLYDGKLASEVFKEWATN